MKEGGLWGVGLVPIVRYEMQAAAPAPYWATQHLKLPEIETKDTDRAED
jgi:hypothetical protein